MVDSVSNVDVLVVVTASTRRRDVLVKVLESSALGTGHKEQEKLENESKKLFA